MLASLPNHQLQIALLRPQIPQNTGNIARTCLLTGCSLHLVRPMGFVLDDRKLARSGLDYWPSLNPTVHASAGDFDRARQRGGGQTWIFDSVGDVNLFDVEFGTSDWLVFGSETHGVGEAVMAEHVGRVVAIPQLPRGRCLNLATSVGIAIYTALGALRRSPTGNCTTNLPSDV